MAFRPAWTKWNDFSYVSTLKNPLDYFTWRSFDSFFLSSNFASLLCHSIMVASMWAKAPESSRSGTTSTSLPEKVISSSMLTQTLSYENSWKNHRNSNSTPSMSSFIKTVGRLVQGLFSALGSSLVATVSSTNLLSRRTLTVVLEFSSVLVLSLTMPAPHSCWCLD